MTKAFSNKDFRGLPEKISKLFEKFNEERQEQLSDINAIQEAVYGINKGQTANWESHLELPNLYEQHQTLKAHIMDSLYTNPEGLFDVTTNDISTQEMAIKQKAMLTDALSKMKIGDTIEKIVDDLIETGETTLFVGWKKVKKLVRRPFPIDFENMDENAPTAFILEEKTVFEGASVKTVSSADFVFDSAQKANWDACSKIFRTYLTLDEIESDKLNTYFTDEVKNALVAEVLKNKEAEGAKRNKVEILEFWGDLELEDGKLLKNWYVVCAGRQAIIRFEPNPFINSPFIYANLIENPKTKRGISPLKCVLPLNAVATKILNTQMDAYSLVVNPPYLAPKGAFKGVQEVAPGKIIEYDSSLLPQNPTPLNFSPALSGWDFVNYFKNCIEATTGVYRTMAGDVANPNRTATELMYSANGQNARLNLLIDAINRKVVLPMIEKIADTIANFTFGTCQICAKIGENRVMVEITDEIRGYEYVYKYSDRKASLERKFRQNEVTQVIQTFSKIQNFGEKINWQECFKFAMEQLGVENSERFIA